MNNEEFMNAYIENTPFVSDALQKALLDKAKRDDLLKQEVERLKQVLRTGEIHE